VSVRVDGVNNCLWIIAEIWKRAEVVQEGEFPTVVELGGYEF